MWGVQRASTGTALVPHTVEIPARLKQGLAQEAAQLAQFQQYEMALPRARWQPTGSQKFPVMVPVGGLYQTNKFNEDRSFATGAIATTQSLNFIRFG